MRSPHGLQNIVLGTRFAITHSSEEAAKANRRMPTKVSSL